MLVLVGETSNGTGDIANPSHLSLVLSSNDTRLTLDSEIRSFSGNLVVDSQSSVSWYKPVVCLGFSWSFIVVLADVYVSRDHVKVFADV